MLKFFQNINIRNILNKNKYIIENMIEIHQFKIILLF